MSQPQTESYTAAKGGIAALTHSLAVSLAGKVRVNSISPGWIDTAYTKYDGADVIQHPAGRVGEFPGYCQYGTIPLFRIKQVLSLGENMNVLTAAWTKQMIYHNDYGWTLNQENN